MPFLPKSPPGSPGTSRAGMREFGQLTMFYKTNRNWGLLSPSAGKLYHSEYIVPHGYNVTGNGRRDMHSEKDAGNGKKTCGRSYAETLSDKPCGKWAKPPISSGNPKSGNPCFQIWKCSQSINGFEPKGL